jgi:hypothetical protein
MSRFTSCRVPPQGVSACPALPLPLPLPAVATAVGPARACVAAHAQGAGRAAQGMWLVDHVSGTIDTCGYSWGIACGPASPLAFASVPLGRVSSLPAAALPGAAEDWPPQAEDDAGGAAFTEILTYL